ADLEAVPRCRRAGPRLLPVPAPPAVDARPPKAYEARAPQPGRQGLPLSEPPAGGAPGPPGQGQGGAPEGARGGRRRPRAPPSLPPRGRSEDRRRGGDLRHRGLPALAVARRRAEGDDVSRKAAGPSRRHGEKRDRSSRERLRRPPLVDPSPPRR